MAKTKVFLAGVGVATMFAGDQLILEAKALTENSISLGLTAEEIRGGAAAQLIGRYFHSSTFELTLQDAMFRLEYIALNVGAKINPADIGELASEQVTAGNQSITITGTATDFLGQGLIGWIAPPDSEDWTKITFGADGKTAENVTTVTAGEIYCVRYMNNASAESITVNAAFVPDEVTLVLKMDLFKASKGNTAETSSKIGVLQVEIPRFQLSGTMDLTLNMTGAAQMPLNGMALSNTDGSEGCEGTGYYAKLKQIMLNESWMDNLEALGAVPSTLSIPSGGEATLNVWGVFKGNVSNRIIAPTDLTYTVTPSTGLATVVNGVVTAEAVEAEQTGSILVTLKNPTPNVANVSTTVPVTVTVAG